MKEAYNPVGIENSILETQVTVAVCCCTSWTEREVLKFPKHANKHIEFLLKNNFNLVFFKNV